MSERARWIIVLAIMPILFALAMEPAVFRWIALKEIKEAIEDGRCADTAEMIREVIK